MRFLFIFLIVVSLFVSMDGQGHTVQRKLEVNRNMTVEEVKKQAREVLIGQDVALIEKLISSEHDYGVGYDGKGNMLVIRISFSLSELKIPFSAPAALVIKTYLIKVACEDGKMIAIEDVEQGVRGL